MRLDWQGRGSDGRIRLKATPEDYDGSPQIPALVLEHQPLFVHDDVLAVASVLLFGEYCSGRITLPRKVSPEVANAVETYLEPAWVSPSPVELTPRANSTGDGVLVVSRELEAWHPRSKWGERRVSTLISLDSSEAAGSLVSTHGVVTNSNASAIAAVSRETGVLECHLAVGLLYCETFFASNILVQGSLAQNVSRERLTALRDLLSSCKINLDVAFE